MTEWPKRPDGSNMTMGEMTAEQRLVQWRAAATRFKAEIEQPHVQAQIARIMNTDPPQRNLT